MSSDVELSKFKSFMNGLADRALLAVSHGDANNSGAINIDDAIYIQNHIFAGGPAPQPKNLCGDADCSGTVDISDVQYLIEYIFGGVPAPQDCY